jgi:hypothetical protein
MGHAGKDMSDLYDHDEYIDFFAKLDSNLLEVRRELGISRPNRIRVPPDARPQ